MLSWPGPGFNPWLENSDPVNCAVWPKNKKKKKKNNINVSLKKELAILISDERDFKKKRIIIDKWNYFTEKEKWSFSSSPPALSPPEIYITLYNKHFTFLSQTLRIT